MLRIFVFQGGWLFGFLAFVAFTWVYMGFCGFMRLLRLWLFASSALPVGGFGFSHPLISQLVFSNARLIESPLFRSSCDCYFLDSLPLIESSLVRSSWGGCRPPNPPAAFSYIYCINIYIYIYIYLP